MMCRAGYAPIVDAQDGYIAVGAAVGYQLSNQGQHKVCLLPALQAGNHAQQW